MTAGSDIRPSYYQGDGGMQPWDVIRAFGLDFFTGNAVKYICRAGRKNPDPLEDLRKARTYLNEKIRELEAAASP